MFLVSIKNVNFSLTHFSQRCVCVSKEDGSRVFSSRTFYSFLLDNILFIRRVRFDLSLNIGHKITTEYHNEDVFELSSSTKYPKINWSVLFLWFCELSELRNVQQLRVGSRIA